MKDIIHNNIANTIRSCFIAKIILPGKDYTVRDHKYKILALFNYLLNCIKLFTFFWVCESYFETSHILLFSLCGALNNVIPIMVITSPITPKMLGISVKNTIPKSIAADGSPAAATIEVLPASTKFKENV